jgi:N utilization substance protein B
MKPRTRARSIALQALYEIDMTGHSPGTVLENRLQDHSLKDSSLEDFARKIVRGIEPIRNLLDKFIAEQAPEWPIDQLSLIDRNLLRIALWEFAVSEETPIKVAINEAVELAKLYGSDSTPRFVNGVLGSLAARQSDIRRKLRSQVDKDPSIGNKTDQERE